MELDMSPTTVELPRYAREDLKALAEHNTKPGHTTLSMKQYLIELIAAEKKKAKL